MIRAWRWIRSVAQLGDVTAAEVTTLRSRVQSLEGEVADLCWRLDAMGVSRPSIGAQVRAAHVAHVASVLDEAGS